jgi:hypothetical protein
MNLQASSDASLLKGVYDNGVSRVEHLVSLLTASPLPELSVGRVDIDLNKRPASPGVSNMSEVLSIIPLLNVSLNSFF